MAHREPVGNVEPTIGKLVNDALTDGQDLIKKLIQLAKSELKVSAKFGGVGIGLFAAAGFLVLLGVILLSVAFAFFLTMTGLHPAWCFLIVFGAYMLIAAILAFLGIRSVKKVRAPQRTLEQASQAKLALKPGPSAPKALN